MNNYKSIGRAIRRGHLEVHHSTVLGHTSICLPRNKRVKNPEIMRMPFGFTAEHICMPFVRPKGLVSEIKGMGRRKKESLAKRTASKLKKKEGIIGKLFN